jgi:hypothetical protein
LVLKDEKISFNKLKGNPVKIRSYPRSCKLCELCLIHYSPAEYKTTVQERTGRVSAAGKPEDLPNKYYLGFRVKGRMIRSYCRRHFHFYYSSRKFILQQLLKHSKEE